LGYSWDVDAYDAQYHGTRLDILKLLFENGADIELVGPQVLELAIRGRDLQAVKLLLSLGVDMHRPGYSGFFPMHLAAKSGQLDILDCLFRAGGDVNGPPREKNHLTALHYAVKYQRYECVRFLLEAGAHVDQLQQYCGKTLLEACLSTRRYMGAFSNLPPRCAEMFKLLLSLGAAINGPDLRTHRRRGDSALTTLILRDSGEELIQIALDAGADINQRGSGKSARTPIQAAAEVGNLEVVRALLARGADINAPPAEELGWTALQAACSSEAPTMELVHFLLDHGADVHADAGYRGGVTALQGAAIQGHIKIALLLIKLGADVNAKPATRNGRMALDGAAKNGRLNMVKLLLNAGARSEVMGRSGYDRAIRLAERSGHWFMRRLFKEHLEGLTPW
jgi:ankyrin repeat protein